MSSLPNLTKSLEKHLKDVGQEIKDLPPSCTESPQSTILNLCDKFIEKIRHYTEGARDYEAFHQSLMKKFELLKETLRSTHPRLLLGNGAENNSTDDNRGQDSQFLGEGNISPYGSLLTFL